MRIQHQFLLHYSLFLFFLATTTLISPSLGGLLGKCNPSDHKALMNFRKSLNKPDDSRLLLRFWSLKPGFLVVRVAGLISIGGEISGQIPSSVGDLPYLVSIVFTNVKNITGSIPRSITKLKHLTMLDLSYLSLSGTPWFDNINDLWRNQFEFDLANVKFPKDLNWLDISHNKIFGGIPEEIKGLGNLYKLKVGYNMLCGKIPTGGNMQRFKSTSFFHNKCLCGSPCIDEL
ncbi:hypothetical protein MKX01_027125 [Papaver californicum]|nr:hypothetical protein MKX01_027125 [Papaver californicum]